MKLSFVRNKALHDTSTIKLADDTVMVDQITDNTQHWQAFAKTTTWSWTSIRPINCLCSTEGLKPVHMLILIHGSEVEYHCDFHRFIFGFLLSEIFTKYAISWGHLQDVLLDFCYFILDRFDTHRSVGSFFLLRLLDYAI